MTIRVAIQGELGSFSHEAALGMESAATIIPCAFSTEVFRLLIEGVADAAVIPIENSLAGSVLEHYDLLFSKDVAIEREFLLRISHHLIAAPGVDMSRVRKVMSHPVALAQCRRFFEAHPEMIPTASYDTAGSVRQVIESAETETAAIAGRQAAILYNGEILAAGIEDSPQNYTRFFLIKRRDKVHPNPESNKVSVGFNVENRPGSLVRALLVFDGHGTNLTKIESRPVPGQPWRYTFYVDYQLSDAAIADAILQELSVVCFEVKELGRYRAADNA